MKIYLFYLLTYSFIYLSKSQDIIKPTNYTIDYLETINSHNITCQSDADCPEYSKCEKNTNGKSSFCKFGSFLCPKKPSDLLKKEKNNDHCIFINTDIWDIDKEEIIKNANENQKTEIKPILKICPKHNRYFNCETEKCSMDEDCISGKCSFNKCIINNQLDHQIYRCSGTDNNIKCGKQLGMECNSDEDCYSGICYHNTCVKKGFKESNKKETIMFVIIFPLTIIFIIFGIPYLLCGVGYRFKKYMGYLFKKHMEKERELERAKQRKIELEIMKEREKEIRMEKEIQKEKKEFFTINIEN